MTLGELVRELTRLQLLQPGSEAWEVEADLGPVDVPVLRVGTWWGPEDGNPGRVVLDCDR